MSLERKTFLIEERLQQLGVGIRPVNDPFFDESYEVCRIFQRKGVTIDDEEELCHEIIKEFQCYVPGCKKTFQMLLDYEMHYNSAHRYSCTQCKTFRPNPRLLEIHIQETHDAFFKVMSEKQAMYQCYDSKCDIKFNTPVERREHCIKIHNYPKKYRFDDTSVYKKDFSHKTKKMEVDSVVESNKMAVDTVESNKMVVDTVESNKMDVDTADINKKEKSTKIFLNKNQKSKMFTKSVSTAVCKNNVETIPPPTTIKTKATPLSFIPRQVQKSFSKVLTNNQTREKNVLESETMKELVDSLPNN